MEIPDGNNPIIKPPFAVFVCKFNLLPHLYPDDSASNSPYSEFLFKSVWRRRWLTCLGCFYYQFISLFFSPCIFLRRFICRLPKIGVYSLVVIISISALKSRIKLQSYEDFNTFFFWRSGANWLSYSMGESHETTTAGINPPSSLHAVHSECGQEWCNLALQGVHKIDIRKQMFCNRPLNMKNIRAVGFDMDYTLAQYKLETFETLTYEGTIKKLVYDLGYPQELLDWSFDWNYMVRGLVLDKKRGNILKMDQHKYVKVAYHGFKELSKEVKVATYGNTLVRDSFDEPGYALVDTLFSLAEAYMFAQLVEFKDSNPEKVPDYAHMYKDVRAAVDLCHRDGTLKQMVAKDPKRYINEDNSLVPMLKMFKDSGRFTFLATNSLWDYTNIVMNFLCCSRTMDGINKCTFDWLQYFDIVITGCNKPSFFHEDKHSNLFEVELESGMLINTNNGSPITRVGSFSGVNKTCKVFQGGNVAHLHRLFSIESSSQVLYVGDHIYGDILRSKKALGWRTMLVVPELEREIELLLELKNTCKELQSLRSENDRIDNKLHHLKWRLKYDIDDDNDNEKRKSSSHHDALQAQREKARLNHQLAHLAYHQKFHKIWGQLMKTGYQNSRFAHQVERFACLYTSQVTNLGLYSPDKYFRPHEDFMAHEWQTLAVQEKLY